MADEQKVFKVLYDYTDVPTLKKFAMDDSRIRGVMGPFGCLSNDTEYLSKKGWRRFDEYRDDDLIAEFNLDTRRIEFRRPLSYVKLPCESFLHLKNKYGIDQLLSEEHTVLFTTRYNPDTWQTISASSLAVKHNTLKDGWSGRIPTVFKAPEMDEGLDLTDDELRLMVAISADGHFPERSKKCCVCVRKERKKERLRKLLTACEIEWTERNYPARPTETSFDFIPPLYNKELWEYINADEHQLSIIADEFVHWDSCLDCYGGRIFSSIVKKNADFIQYALATTGVRSTIAEVEYDDENWKKGCRVYAGTGASDLSMRQAPKIEWVKSADGFKYCFATSTGFFVARRNGRIFITGNSGKSSAMVMEIIKRAHEQSPGPDGIRRSRWAVIRNTYVQLKDTTIRTVHDWFPPKIFGEYRISDHNYIITAFPGVHIEIMFRALDRPEQIANLLSLELTGAWINEAREIPKSIFQALDGRIGRYPSFRDGGCTWLGIFMDTNPPDEESWWYTLFEKRRPPNAKIFKQPSGLSPQAENTKHLPKDYYKNLAMGKDEMYVRVYIHGQYGYMIDGEPVFKSFRDNVHVASHPLSPVKGLDILIGFDFGLNPTCVLGQIHPRGQLFILDELISDGMGLKQFCLNRLLPLLRTKYHGFKIMGYGDPAGTARTPTDETTCFDILHSSEIGLVYVDPADTNALVPRIGAVEGFLNKMVDGEPGFVMSPDCHTLRKAMNGAYHYDIIPGSKTNQHKEKPSPVKDDYSHVSDALQMLCMYVDKKVENDARHKAFLASMKTSKHRVADGLVGY